MSSFLNHKVDINKMVSNCNQLKEYHVKNVDIFSLLYIYIFPPLYYYFLLYIFFIFDIIVAKRIIY